MAGERQEWRRIGEQVRQARLSLGKSQRDLADTIGLDRTMLAKVETGSRRLDAVELARLSQALGVSMEYLIEPQPAVVSRRTAILTEETDTPAARSSERLEIALVEWLRDVRQLVDIGVLRSRPVLRYPGTVASENDARRVARWLRQQAGLGNEPIDSILELCERAGQWVLVTDLPGDGASLIVTLPMPPGSILVLDTMLLFHFTLADRLDVLKDLLVERNAGQRRWCWKNCGRERKPIRRSLRLAKRTG